MLLDFSLGGFGISFLGRGFRGSGSLGGGSGSGFDGRLGRGCGFTRYEGLQRLALGGNRALKTDHEGTENGVCDSEVTLELTGKIRGRSDVHQYIITLGLVVDGIRQTALAPLVYAINRAAILGDEVGEAVDELTTRLLLKSGVDDVHDFVLVHLLTHLLMDLRP